MNLINTFKKLFENATLVKNTDNSKRKIYNKTCLPQQAISYNALKIIKRLNKAGYEAYLVGGGVRDLLLSLTPKDFDVATNATPEQIRKLFRNCRLIGRRFRLAHVYFKNEIIEVSTFRTTNSIKSEHKCINSGMILRDNTYGNQEDDAQRRDFTINALYYDPASECILDYTNGLADIEKHEIRIIGDPIVRYQEDPIRMLRAIRFAAKLKFAIAHDTKTPFTDLQQLLWNVPPARLFEEVLKLFFSGHAHASYQQLIEYQFFTLLFPQTKDFMQDENFLQLLEIALKNTDIRINKQQSINPAFLFAVILWFPLKVFIQQQISHSSQIAVRQHAMQNVIQIQLETLTIPKRYTLTMREIWELQYRFTKRQGKRAFKTLLQPRFRAAYDFLLLRSTFDPKLKPLADWWTTFQTASKTKQNHMIKQLSIYKKSKRH